MGHNANTNYTVSSSITTENAGDSVSTGTLPNQAGNGSVILTITPNPGFTVDAADFTIGSIAPDNTSTVTGTTVNPNTGNFYSVIQYQFFSPNVGGNNTTLPNQVESVNMFNSEYNYDATANTFTPVTANNLVYVYVSFSNNFVMPNTNVTLNIDIDGSANATNAIQYPTVWETWSSPLSNVNASGVADYTISAVGDTNLTNMNLSTIVSGSPPGGTTLLNISGLVDDGVRTLLMTVTYETNSGFYFSVLTESEAFTAYGLADWLPFFETEIASETFNTNGELTKRVIEYYYTNPIIGDPVQNPLGLNPAMPTYGLGHLYVYTVNTQATVYPLAGGGTGGVAPLALEPPFGPLVSSTSSSELGDEVEDANPQVTTIPDTTFFGEIKNVVFNTDKEINAIGGESRPISVYGTPGATYNIVVSNGSETYDDSSDTFTASATQIDGVIPDDGINNHLIKFPRVTSTTTYTFTLNSEFGTKLPANITDSVTSNIGSIVANATRTFTISFNSASKVSAAMPANIVFSFADLDSAATGTNTFKAAFTGDIEETFGMVDAFADAPDATMLAAMSLTSGSADGWQFGITGAQFSSGEGIDNLEEGIDSFTLTGTLQIQSMGDSNVVYQMAIDNLITVT